MDIMSYSQVEGTLYNYKIIKASIENNKLKLENLELEDPEDGMSGISYGEPSSKTNKISSVVESAAIRNMERKEIAKKELGKAIRKETNRLKIIDNALTGLSDIEKNIIAMFYIEDKTWLEVAEEINYSQSWCQELRCMAMEKILLIINGNSQSGRKVGEK